MTLEALLLALRNIILQDPAAAQKELQDIPAFDALIVEDRRWCRTQPKAAVPAAQDATTTGVLRELPA